MGAIGEAYANVAQYKAATKKTSSGDDTQLALDLISISRHIERRLGAIAVGFNKEASASTRYQRVAALTNSKTLWLDVPLAEAPTSVILDTDDDGSWADETALTLTEYSGDVIYHPQGWDQAVVQPIRGIELTGSGTRSSALWPTRVMVQIIGKHGFPAVPEDIRAACIALTGIYRLEGPRATGTLTSADAVLSATPAAVRIVNELQGPYRDPGSMF